MLVVGVMSGTSFDGIDVGVCQVTIDTLPAACELIAFECHPMPLKLRQDLMRIVDGVGSAREICRANVDVAEIISDCVLRTLENHQIDRTSVDCIASHGQTIWHEVEPDSGKIHSSLQIGDGSFIAARTGITTVCDFRVADIAVGGQGAPLTSTLDCLVLASPVAGRCIQNIGGMGNVTLVLPSSHFSDVASLLSSPSSLAFDTGPGNVWIDAACDILSDGAKLYDDEGKMAASGSCSNVWLRKIWESIPFFQRLPPKSTGRELFSRATCSEWVNSMLMDNIDANDIICTLTWLTALSIVYAYTHHCPSSAVVSSWEVIVGGGGAQNTFLMQLLQDLLFQCAASDDWLLEDLIPGREGYRRVEIARFGKHEDVLGISSDGKEAMAFALLGALRMKNIRSNVPSCTGANRSVLLGKICLP
jgi:anhydro-N-acetylmuramic acid kinase